MALALDDRSSWPPTRRIHGDAAPYSPQVLASDGGSVRSSRSCKRFAYRRDGRLALLARGARLPRVEVGLGALRHRSSMSPWLARKSNTSGRTCIWSGNPKVPEGSVSGSHRKCPRTSARPVDGWIPNGTSGAGPPGDPGVAYRRRAGTSRAATNSNRQRSCSGALVNLKAQMQRFGSARSLVVDGSRRGGPQW